MWYDVSADNMIRRWNENFLAGIPWIQVSFTLSLIAVIPYVPINMQEF